MELLVHRGTVALRGLVEALHANPNPAGGTAERLFLGREGHMTQRSAHPPGETPRHEMRGLRVVAMAWLRWRLWPLFQTSDLC